MSGLGGGERRKEKIPGGGREVGDERAQKRRDVPREEEGLPPCCTCLSEKSVYSDLISAGRVR